MTEYPGPIFGARLTPELADAQFDAFPGIYVVGEKVDAALKKLVVVDDPCVALVKPETVARARANGNIRWPGMRDPLTAVHPTALKLRKELEHNPGAIPIPDPAIIARLQALPGFAIEGNIVTIYGVPIPAGESQTAYYVVLRWRPLFSPLAHSMRVYRGDLAYDAVHVTDEMQESLLLVSTRIHRDNLVKLQLTAPDLFVAIWLRQVEQAEALVAAIPAPLLPPCYARSRLTDRRKCLMIVCDIMSEHERGFDLQYALRFKGGVTRTSVKDALESCSSMTAVYAIEGNTHRHIAGSVAHARVVHPTMNRRPPTKGEDPVFQAAADSFVQSRVHANQYRRTVWVCGEMPVRYFIGVESAMLMPVMLIQMTNNLVRHEGRFWLRGARAFRQDERDARSHRLMSLAIIIASEICAPTARAMMHDVGNLPDGDPARIPDDLWLRRTIPTLISNPRMKDAIEIKVEKGEMKGRMERGIQADKVIDPFANDGCENFKSSYDGARRRAGKCCAAVGEPGWTQGFHFDAWRQPHAELDFLRKCCRYVRYEPKYVPMRDRWYRAMAGAKRRIGPPVTPADAHTGLPGQHPVEQVQGVWRELFDRLHFAEQVKDAKISLGWLHREVYIREIASLLPALSPITDDSERSERIWADVKSRPVRFAVQAAWNW